MEQINFKDLNLSKKVLEIISKKGFKTPTQIQEKIIPIIFEQKYDLVGIAQTGTGKTAAFGLPLIDLIDKKNHLPQAIIVTPTRELAIQVSSQLNDFSNKKLNVLTVYGGSSINNQIKSLKNGVDIVVGTPGRIVDLLKRKKLVLKKTKYFVLDEADEMLNMGFIDDIEFILKSSHINRKVYLFSATMPERIKSLSQKYMKKRKIIEIENKKEINNLIEHGFYKSKNSNKYNILSEILNTNDFFYGIIFCRTKVDVEKVTSNLKNDKHNVNFIHGDVMQNKRERILKKFKNLKLNILVATDVAARGIDVENLSHIINFNLPEDVESYIHRTGRTGRAGNKGKAISIITPTEMKKISNIEKQLKIKIENLSNNNQNNNYHQNKNKIDNYKKNNYKNKKNLNKKNNKKNIIKKQKLKI